MESASPHEVKLVDGALVQMAIPETPKNLTGVKACDSGELDFEFKSHGTEVMAPHCGDRENAAQDGRRPRGCCRCWNIGSLLGFQTFAG